MQDCGGTIPIYPEWDLSLGFPGKNTPITMKIGFCVIQHLRELMFGALTRPMWIGSLRMMKNLWEWFLRQ